MTFGWVMRAMSVVRINFISLPDRNVEQPDLKTSKKKNVKAWASLVYMVFTFLLALQIPQEGPCPLNRSRVGLS